MNKLELAFRKEICEQMRGIWNITIHTENDLNPGVPDLSYVFKMPGHETGWLELKAIQDITPYHFHVEPSQHRWIDAHCDLVPVCFLLAVGDMFYLVGGGNHHRLSNPIEPEELKKCSIASGERRYLRSVLHSVLRPLTWRHKS